MKIQKFHDVTRHRDKDFFFSANGIDPDATSKQDAVYAAVQLCALLAGRKR